MESRLMNLVILLNQTYLGSFIKFFWKILAQKENEHKHSDYHRHFHLMEENKAVEI